MKPMLSQAGAPDKLIRAIKAIRILMPSLAMIILGIWLGWLYSSGDVGAVVIFLVIFAPQPLIGGVVGGIVGSVGAMVLRRHVPEARKIRYLLLSLIYWFAAGVYIGGCIAILAAFLIALLIWVLSIFGALFAPVVYTGSLGVAGVLVALAALIMDGLVASRLGPSYEQRIWAPPGYALLSLLTAMPALIGLGACCVFVAWQVIMFTIAMLSLT